MAKHESLRAWIVLILPPNQNAGFGIVAVQPLSHIQPFVTPWTAAPRPPCPSPSPGICSNSCPLSHGDAVQPSHPLSSPSPPACNLSRHQGLSQ